MTRWQFKVYPGKLSITHGMMNVIYGHITTAALTVQSLAAGGRATTVTSDGTVELWRVRIFARDGFIQYLRMHETVSIAFKYE